jgi:transmembrane sensor
MEKDFLIKKWLDNNLNAEELEAFKKLQDYEALVKLNQSVQHFKAPEYNTPEELNTALHTIKSHKKTKPNWLQMATRIAAAFIICFGVYYYTTTLDTTVKTLAAQKSTVVLPDNSSVAINALSTVVYNKRHWDKNREVELHGEAFFKVAKGSTFNVKTTAGTVSVYGTQFNVKQRENYFEVICYEGLVGVTYNSQLTKLKAGDGFLILDGTLIAKEKESAATPSWLNNLSYFKSLPYKEVIAEFERQYNFTINSQNINTEQLFTGSFSHNDIDIALKSITLPLQISYRKTDHTITLKRE